MPFSWTFVWIIALLLLQVLFTVAVICISSATHVYFRDIGHALPLLLQLWMLATPVAYPLSSVPEWLQPFYLLNPMAPLVHGYRQVLLHRAPPDPGFLFPALVVILMVATMAYLGFKRAEQTFADVI